MRIRRITSNSEALAERILRATLRNTGWTIALQLPLQVALEKHNDWLTKREFEFYTRGRLDFTVYRETTHIPEFAIEFDGFGHDDPVQIERDIMKNRLCANAGLPLLRIGRLELGEVERISVLEWLVGRFVAWQQAGPSRAEIEAIALDQNELPNVIRREAEFRLHTELPFPGNLAAAGRLFDRFGIAVRMKDFETFAQIPAFNLFWLIGRGDPSWEIAPYQLEVDWPGQQLPGFEDGAASEFLADKIHVRLRGRAQRDKPLFEAVGRARFAWAHKTNDIAMSPHPYLMSTDQSRALGLAPQDLPWLDASGVANELAIHAALSRVERWAEGSLANLSRSD